MVAPALTISLLFSLRGSFRAQVVWLGLLSWVAYNYATYSFGLQYTTLFVVHVALLSLAVFAIAIVIRRFDLTKVRSAVAAHGAVRYMSLFLFLVAGVFLILWLSDLLPATLTNSIPARLKDLQSTSNPIEVLDLSFVLPLLILAGIRLWQRKANGLVLGGSMLAFMAAVMVAISPGSLIFGDGSFDAIYPVIAAISAVLLAVFVILLGTVKRFKEV